MKNGKMFFQGKLFLRGFFVFLAIFGFCVTGVQKTDAAVGSCPNANVSMSNSNGQVSLTGSDTSGDFYLCIYNPQGQRVTIGMKGNGSVSAATTGDGLYTGVITVGHSCGSDVSSAGDCRATTQVGSVANNGTTGGTNGGTTGGTAASGGTGAIEIKNPIGTNDFTTLVQNVLKWLLSMAGGIALLMLIYGGVVYITSTGDQKQADQGKRIITWTVLGLVVILLSYSIILVIDEIFTK